MKFINLLKGLPALVAGMLFSQSTEAQMVSCNAFLQGKYVELGVNTNGAFGSSVEAPSGYHPRGSASVTNTCTGMSPSFGTGLGFVADPAKDGWSVGSPNYIGDFFLPGSPQEGWAIRSNGSEYYAYNGGPLFSSGLSGGNTSCINSGTSRSTIWEGTNGSGLNIRQVVTLDTGAIYFAVNVTITNTSSSTQNDVYYMRTVDPDQEQPITGDYTTINFISYQLPNPQNATLVSAIGTSYPQAYLGLGTLDCRAKCFINNYSLTPEYDMASLHSGASGARYSGSYTSDVGVGLVFNLGDLAPGASTSLSFAYILDSSEITRIAAFTATAPNWTATGDSLSYRLSGDTAVVCQNSTTTITIPSPGPYTWHWTSLSGDTLSTYTGTSVTVNTNTSLVRLRAIGTPTETDGAGCTPQPDTLYVSVKPEKIVPANPTASGGGTVCSGNSVSLFSTTTTSGAGYIWSGPSFFSSTLQNPTLSSPTTASTGTYSVYAMSSRGCRSNMPATVSVNVLAAPGEIYAYYYSESPCGPATLYAGGTETGETIYYQGTTSGGTSTMTPTTTVSVTTSGTYYFRARNNTTGCWGPQQSVEVELSTPPTIYGTLTVCEGQTTGVTAGTSGTWSSSNTSVATIDESHVITGVSAGTATITFVSYDGCIATATVTVLAMPSSISGASSICEGTTTLLTSSPAGGSWSSSNTSVATVNVAGVVTGVSAGSVSITYTAPSGCMVKKDMDINMAAPAISGPSTLCNGSEASYDVYGSPTVGISTPMGSWSSSNTSVATVDDYGTLTTVGAGITTISYTLSSGCFSTKTVTVLVTPASISGSTSVCAGSTTVLSSMTGGGTWSSSDGSVATVGVSGIVSGVSNGSATISYTLSNGCYTTSMMYVAPVPSSISGLGSICVGSSLSLSASPSGGSWSVNMPSIATIDSVGNVTGVTGGNAIVSYTIGDGCRVTGVVTVNANPSAIGGTLSVCEGATTTLTCAPGGGSWSSSNTSVATIGTDGVVSGLMSGTSTIEYTTAAGCSRSTVVTVTGLPSISGTLSTCTGGGTTTLVGSPSGGVWSSSNTGVATVSGGVVSGITANTVNISYTVGGSCRNIVQVTVNARPAALTGANTVCVGSSTTFASTTSGGSWSSSDDAIATVSGGVVSGVSGGVATITYTMTGGCFVVKTITVNAAPSISSSSTTTCIGTNLALTGSPSGGTWSPSTGAVGTVSSAGSFRGISAGSVLVTYTVSGCSNTVLISVTSGSGTLSGPTSVCTFGTATITPSVSGGTWSSSNTALATVNSDGEVSGVATGTVTISYSNGGCVVTRSMNVIGGVSAVTGTASACVGSTTTLAGTPAGGTWSSSTPSVGTVAIYTGVVRGMSAGTTSITYRLTNGCTRVSTYTVNAAPDSIMGSSSICLGFTTALTNGVSGGTWSSSNTAIATVDAGTGIVTGVSNGTATISYTLSGGCFRTRVVNVGANTPASPANANVCVGGTITLTDPASGGVWSSSNPARATINATTGVVTGVAGGPLTITYTFGGGACTRTTTLNVNTNPAVIVGTANACSGRTATLVATATGGTWTSGNTSIATINGATGLWTGVSAGTATITYNIVGCLKFQDVTVNASPAAITGASTVPVGGSTTLASTTSGGTWSSSNTARATVGAGTGIVSGVTTGAVTITYTMPNACFQTRNMTVTASRPGVSGASASEGMLTLYPNPTSGTYTLRTEVKGVFSMLTLDGRVVAEHTVSEVLSTYSMPSQLAAGVYMCKFVGEDGSTSVVRLVYEP